MRGAPLENPSPIEKSLPDLHGDCQGRPLLQENKRRSRSQAGKNAARRPATFEPHHSWTCAVCLPAAFGSGTTAPVRQHSESECHIYRCGCRAAIPGITTRQLLRFTSSPTQLFGAGSRGGRNARATGWRSRASGFPPAIHPRESPVCRQLGRNHRGSPRKVLRFRCTHCAADCCAPQPKNISPLCRNCGR
jgi:hypothetical protein